MSYVIELSCLCQNNDGDEKCISVTVDFRNEDDFDLHDGTFFDHLIGPINDYLSSSNNNNTYHVDDTIEVATHNTCKIPDIVIPIW